MVQGPILLAEDDENHVLLIQNLMKACHILNPLVAVPDGEHVISYLKNDGIYADRERYPPPILLLLDMKMPRVGGLEVLKWLASVRPKPSFPTLVLTGYADLKTMNEAYRLGAQSFLLKPIERREFLPLIEAFDGIHFGQAASK
jgi:CheY-like chemotaxis protein